MGFFSWKTQDTDRSIANAYSVENTFTVCMVDDKGNIWKERNYEGYGEFGGKDYYELLAEMNGVTMDKSLKNYTELMRSKGINMAFKDNSSGEYAKDIKYPNLVENPQNWEYEESSPKICECQGYFYE
jgi:hypothetical protein